MFSSLRRLYVGGVVSICLLATCWYFLSYIKVPSLVIFVIWALACVGLFLHSDIRQEFRHIVKKISTFSHWKKETKYDAIVWVVLTFLSVFSLCSFLAFQQIDPMNGLRLFGETAHDSFWHIALMESLNKGLPAQNPLLLGEKLVGYHYFTDLLWVAVHQLTGLPFLTLYLVVSPIFLAFLFTLSVLFLSWTVFSEKWQRYATAVLLLFGSSFAFLVPLLFRSHPFLSSVFWVDQPPRMLINQQMVFSLAIVNILLMLIYQGEKSKKTHWLKIGFLLGVLVGVKVYAAAIMFPFIFLIFAYELLKNRKLSVNKNLKVIAAGVLSVTLAGAILLLVGNTLGFPFFFSFGWFPKTMFETSQRLNFPTWEIHRELFVQTHNIPRLFLWWISAIGIFLIGNFNVRIVGLFTVPVLILLHLRTKKLPWISLLLWTAIALTAVSLPLLFLQKGVVWNTIQFFMYAFAPSTLLLIMGTSMVVRSLDWQKKIFLFFIVLSLPTTIWTFSQNFQLDRYQTFPSSITAPLWQARDQLSQEPDRVLVVDSDLNPTSLVPALTGHAVFWSDPIILSILGQDHEERKICPQQADEVILKEGIVHFEKCPHLFDR